MNILTNTDASVVKNDIVLRQDDSLATNLAYAIGAWAPNRWASVQIILTRAEYDKLCALPPEEN